MSELDENVVVTAEGEGTEEATEGGGGGVVENTEPTEDNGGDTAAEVAGSGEAEEEEEEEEEDGEEQEEEEEEEEGEFTDEEDEDLGTAMPVRHLPVTLQKNEAEPAVPLQSIGSVYQGEYKHGRMDGFGRYTFSNGNYYVGYFADGQFEGEGTLFFPNKGKYVGVWHDGRAVSGDFIFCDNLLYEETDWNYCTGRSRIFWSEIEQGVKPAGAEQLHNSHPTPKAPKGSFDVGDGYYNPETGKVYDYHNSYLRTPDKEMVEWIVAKCRFIKE